MYKAGSSKVVTQDERVGSQYPHRLTLYDKPPLFDVTLEEFERCALNRLRILAEIETSAARNRSWEETKNVTETLCDKYLPLHHNSARGFDLETERRRDVLGHFVLRLAFCRSEDLRRRLTKAETTLFKYRYEETSASEREPFLRSCDFQWTPVDDNEKEQYQRELLSLYHGPKNEVQRQQQFNSEKYYKVKWTKVPDLVEKRRVFLKRGCAYVPSREQSSIIYQAFEENLGKALELTAKALPRLDEDTRLVPILSNLSQGFLAGVPTEWSNSTEGSTDEIKAEMVDDLARKHFPLCMRNHHENLRKDHHLKHFGRLHYGLFLKVLGLSVEEAIVFWRKSFSRITDDKFNKEYKYNIRHSYGLEGRRANYPAKSCQQILMPGQNEQGCPYRFFSKENLQTALISHYSSHGLTEDHLPEIMSTIKAGHFHVACTRVFELTHAKYEVKKGEGVGSGESVTHPNQYAARSIELEKNQLMEVDK